MAVSLRMVKPVVPTDPREKAELEEDLGQMGCEGFLARPWNLKDEEIVREVIGVPLKKWKGTSRSQPED